MLLKRLRKNSIARIAKIGVYLNCAIENIKEEFINRNRENRSVLKSQIEAMKEDIVGEKEIYSTQCVNSIKDAVQKAVKGCTGAKK